MRNFEYTNINMQSIVRATGVRGTDVHIRAVNWARINERIGGRQNHLDSCADLLLRSFVS